MITWPAPLIPTVPGTMPPVKIFDSTGQALAVPTSGPVARIYVCGVTPYDATHIGHAATYIAFDLLHRAWLDAGFEVQYASNVTDVDDPLLERANQTGQDWWELAQEQTALFAQDMTALGVIPPDTYVGAVESIPTVVSAIAQMLNEGTAYRVPTNAAELNTDQELGDVYADLSKDSRFGTVSNFDLPTQIQLFGERGGDPDRPGKKSPLDPLLWRRERAGEPTWDGGELGTGRPGWHIECAVIANGGLGSHFDVQGGGTDLLFPHHEMSTSHLRVLSQDDAAGASHHMHAALISYQGAKMSKSLGNLVFVSQLRASGVNPMVLRLALLNQHYATEWEWTQDLLDAAGTRYNLWVSALAAQSGPDAQQTVAAMRTALSDNLDSPRALTAVDDWANRALSQDLPANPQASELLTNAISALLGVTL